MPPMPTPPEDWYSIPPLPSGGPSGGPPVAGPILNPYEQGLLQPSDAEAEAGVSDFKNSEWEEMMRKQLADSSGQSPAGPFATSGPPQPPRDPPFRNLPQR